MKKAVLIMLVIALVAIVSVSFVACSTATVQGQLKDVWRPYEKYTYSVVDGVNEAGTYVVEIIHSNGGTIQVGANSVDGLTKGILINGKLNIGNVEYITACYVQLISGGSYLVPKASYKKQTVGGEVTLELSATYNDTQYVYSGTENGVSKEGAIEIKAPTYDNNEIHQLLRGVNALATNFSFSFNVPVAIGESTLASITASCSAKASVPYGEGNKDCFEVVLARSTKVNGKNQKLYYAAEAIEIDGWKLPYVLIKFVEPTAEGEVIYLLKDISLNQEA